MNNNKDDFYIYEWFNVDTCEVFYVGKGRKNRYKNITQRNQYFKNYYNKYNCNVRIIENKLSEHQAFKLEKEYIQKYREVNQCQCNLADGGEGCTFPDGSWNDLFRRLQYLHDVKGAMDCMDNEEDYCSENLKTKTLEELEELEYQYYEYKDAMAWFNSLDIYDHNGNVNTGWECFED